MLVRRLLIIGVGSSANIHLLYSISQKTPDILFNNEILLIETSRHSLAIAINKLYEVYKSAYKRLPITANREELLKPHEFKQKLITTHSILLAEEGGAANPERGLSYYGQKANEVMDKISNIFLQNDLSGVVIIGSAGKGTGTLITPYLVKDLWDTLGIEILGFITLPFRTHKTEVDNTKLLIDHLTDRGMTPSKVPLFLLDYEKGIDIYLHQAKKSREKRVGEPRVGEIYKIVVSPLASTIATIVEALNFGEVCSPPMDWSDLSILFENMRGVGTIVYGAYGREEDMMESWKEDLTAQRFLQTKSTPETTNAITIIKSGTSVTVRFLDELSEYYSKSLNAKRHTIYVLERGNGIFITSLVFGFDARTIVPPIAVRKLSFWQRLAKI